MEVCTDKKQYDYAASDNYTNLNKEIDISFGSGTLSGVMNMDTVYFNGLEIPN